jgi:uncharacterized protein (DUF1501 family)
VSPSVATTYAPAATRFRAESLVFRGIVPSPYADSRVVGGQSEIAARHRKLLNDMTATPKDADSLLQFIRRTSLNAYALTDRVQKALADLDRATSEKEKQGRQYRNLVPGIGRDLALVARLIQAGLGTRIFYVAMGGFDTHSDQRKEQNERFEQMSVAIREFFTQLKTSGDDKRVLLMTYSEFGRRVAENASGGTDHGAASCLFLAGPAVRSGPIGNHPSLKPEDLDAGDLRHQVDFRRVYATLLDRWLGCDSRVVLGSLFEHVAVLK